MYALYIGRTTVPRVIFDRKHWLENWVKKNIPPHVKTTIIRVVVDNTNDYIYTVMRHEYKHLP